MLRRPLAMFDSVNVDEIPAAAKAVAGYVDGKWQTFPELVKRYPDAHKVSIAVFAKDNARCLDIEREDATNAQAAEWVRRQWARGVKRPILYTSVSNWKALAAELKAAGIKRRPYGKSYHRWSAHYTFKAHRCGRSCGMPGWTRAGATQWTDKALGRNLDESLCARSFFRA